RELNITNEINTPPKIVGIWSPDGEKAVLVNNLNMTVNAEPYMYITNVRSANLIDLKQQGQSPCWSPDGKQIVFQLPDFSPPGIKRQIYIMNADGSGRTQITKLGGLEPSWS